MPTGGHNKLDVSGHAFGRWTAIKRDETKRSMWLCRCECGTSRLVELSNLRSGKTRSCGCYRDECIATVTYSHGMAGSAEHNIWLGMKTRCYNARRKTYPNYGGRGITVCDRWLESFENFYADMGPRPSSKHSIDRIDVNGNYEPNNCRWATMKQQANNRRPRRRKKVS